MCLRKSELFSPVNSWLDEFPWDFVWKAAGPSTLGTRVYCSRNARLSSVIKIVQTAANNSLQISIHCWNDKISCSKRFQVTPKPPPRNTCCGVSIAVGSAVHLLGTLGLPATWGWWGRGVKSWLLEKDKRGWTLSSLSGPSLPYWRVYWERFSRLLRGWLVVVKLAHLLHSSWGVGYSIHLGCH